MEKKEEIVYLNYFNNEDIENSSQREEFKLSSQIWEESSRGLKGKSVFKNFKNYSFLKSIIKIWIFNLDSLSRNSTRKQESFKEKLPPLKLTYFSQFKP